MAESIYYSKIRLVSLAQGPSRRRTAFMTDITTDVTAFFDAHEVNTDTFDRLADLALESFDARGRFRELLDEYRARVEKGEGEAIKLALGLLVLGRNRDALDWFDKTPDGKQRRYFAARAALALGRHDQALDELKAAAAKGWDPLDVDLQMAAILLRKRDFSGAEALIAKHGQAGRDRATWYFAQGLLHEFKDDWSAAADHYEKALTLDPDHAGAMFRCAYVYDVHGIDRQAIELYERLALKPRAHVNALINLAVIYEDIGRFDEAINCLQRVLKAYPNHTRARLFLKDAESCRQMVLIEAGDQRGDSANRLLETAISEFELSVRARNCLKKMNIRTLGDLVRLSEPELLSFKNFGETSLNEIKALLSKRGLRLGQKPEELGAPVEPEPGAPPAVIVPPGREALLSKPVSELELSVRARRCLQRLNVSTLGDLIQLSEGDLLAARNFGVTSLNEVKARLVENGLQLATREGESTPA